MASPRRRRDDSSESRRRRFRRDLRSGGAPAPRTLPRLTEARTTRLTGLRSGERAAAREAQRALAAAAPARAAPAALPALDEVAALELEEMVGALNALGANIRMSAMQELEERLFAMVRRVGERATEIDGALEERLRADVESAVRQATGATVKEVVRGYHVAAHLDAGARPEWPWIWVAVGDDDSCSSCLDRHGEESTLDDWQRRGPPGSGNLQCCLGVPNCRCELIPIRER